MASTIRKSLHRTELPGCHRPGSEPQQVELIERRGRASGLSPGECLHPSHGVPVPGTHRYSQLTALTNQKQSLVQSEAADSS